MLGLKAEKCQIYIFNKSIHLEAKLSGAGEDWKQNNQEINTKVHVRDGKTQN